MSSVLLVKTPVHGYLLPTQSHSRIVTDSRMAPQDLCNKDRSLPIPNQKYWRCLLLLGGRQLFLKEFCNLSMLGVPLHTRFHLQT